MKLAILEAEVATTATKTDLGELERIFTEAGVSTSRSLTASAAKVAWGPPARIREHDDRSPDRTRRHGPAAALRGHLSPISIPLGVAGVFKEEVVELIQICGTCRKGQRHEGVAKHVNLAQGRRRARHRSDRSRH